MSAKRPAWSRKVNSCRELWRGHCKRLDNPMNQSTHGKLLRNLFFAGFALALFVARPGLAADGAPDSFLVARHKAIAEVLKTPKSDAREKKLVAAIDEVFDYSELAKRSLGSEWENRSDAERKQFQELLEKLVRKSYRKSVDSTVGYTVEYGAKSEKAGLVTVSTKAIPPAGSTKEPVEVSYGLRAADGKWRVVDVVIEGSSLVSTYRSQFTKVIKQKGFAELVSKMKVRLEKP